MTMIQNLINEMNLSKTDKDPIVEKTNTTFNIEQRLASLKIESEIPLFKAKLLTLQNETQILINDQEVSMEQKEKQMDKIIKKGKKLFLEMTSFVFDSPLKDKEFIVNNNNGVITLQGNLGYLFDYFSSEYGVNIERTSKKLSNKNKQSLMFDKNMLKKDFIEMYNKNYYMQNHEDSLI